METTRITTTTTTVIETVKAVEIRDVPGYEGLYRVDDEGNVWSCYVRGSRSGRLGPWQMLKPKQDDNGYPQYMLYRDGKGRMHRGHQIVLLAFVGPPPDGQLVRHLDGCPANNRRSNLTYGTHAENAADTVRHGRQARQQGEKCGRAKLTEVQVAEIRKRLAAGETNRGLAKAFGVGKTIVGSIRLGKNWKHSHPSQN